MKAAPGAIAARDGGEAGADLLSGTRRAFAEALAARPSERHEVRLRFGGRPVLLRVVGSELARQLTRSFESLVEATPDRAPPELSIEAWDRATTGVGCPGIPYPPDTTDFLGLGLVSQFRGGRLLRHERADDVKCFDRDSRELFLCVRDARATGPNDRSKPFTHLLDCWYHDRGLLALHAGVVARRGRGVLIGGASGSGKSTCTIACALAGFDFAGDDCVATEVASGTIRAHACYAAARVDEANLRRFPSLVQHRHPPRDPWRGDKNVVYVSDVAPGRVVAGAEIAAIVVPRVVGSGPSRVREASRAATLRKLAPSTLLRGLGAGARGLAQIAELVRLLPCWELEIGAVPDDVPDLVDAILAGGGGR